MPKKILDEDIKNKIFEMNKSGSSIKEISNETKLSLYFIRKYIKDNIKIENIENNDDKIIEKDENTEDKNTEDENNEDEINEDENNEDEINEDENNEDENISFNEFVNKKGIPEKKEEKIATPIKISPPLVFKNSITTNDISICKNEDVNLTDDKKNELIIKIRGYYKYFFNDLKNIIDQKKINNLFKLNYNEIKVIYDLIKIEIKYKSSIDFKNLAETSLDTIEKISSKTSYDISGLKDELFSDDIFTKNLNILQIEKGNIFNFLTPEKIILLLLLKKSYQCYKINKINKESNELINKDINKSFVEKYKSL